jgi:hypothetical protein
MTPTGQRVLTRRPVVDRWNEQLAAGRDTLWSLTIRAAVLADTPWLDVFCPGCGTSRAIDLMPKPLGLFALKSLNVAKAAPSSA